jgi:hypothetical protein
MYLAVDIFDHDLHAEKMGGNDHCMECHMDNRLPKKRDNTKQCRSCHKSMVASEVRVEVGPGRLQSCAAGYMQAMHGLCIACHEKVQETLVPPNENFSRCANCHKPLPELSGDYRDLHL